MDPLGSQTKLGICDFCCFLKFLNVLYGLASKKRPHLMNLFITCVLFLSATRKVVPYESQINSGIIDWYFILRGANDMPDLSKNHVKVVVESPCM